MRDLRNPFPKVRIHLEQEGDVRAVTQARDLATFRRFMGRVARRHGQILTKTDLAGPLGVSVPAVAQWLGVLETTGLLALIPPYFETFGKRLLKSPRLYWLDSGLASHLLGIRSRLELERSPFYAHPRRDLWPQKSSRYTYAGVDPHYSLLTTENRRRIGDDFRICLPAVERVTGR